MSCTRDATRWSFTAALLMAMVLSGCSLWHPQHDPLADYEQTRRMLATPPGRSPDGVALASFAAEEKKEGSSSLLGSLSPNAGVDRAKSAVKEMQGKGYDPEAAKALFLEGDALFRQASAAQGAERTKQFDAAAAKFALAAERWPNSELEQDALLAQAESLFFADRYPKAEDVYMKLLKKFPNSRHLDRINARRFQIARFWIDHAKARNEYTVSFNFTDKMRPWYASRGAGRQVLERMRLDDPTSALADDATLLMANDHFERRKYLDANRYYEDLRTTFPSSEHQFKAHLLAVKTKMLAYQGAAYAGNELDEAERLIVQIRKQFPEQAAAEREYLDRAYAEVRMKQADRIWRDGQYFDYRHEFGAARHYYEQLIERFPNTPLASQARQRLDEIAGRPERPPQRLAWLVKWFDAEEDKDRPQPIRPLGAPRDAQ